MSAEFEVKPFVKKTFDKNTGLVKFTLDTGTEDKNRKILGTELPDDTLNIDIKVTEVEVDATPMSEMARSHTDYEAHITFESLSGQSGKPVLQHTALYRVDQSIVDEFGKDAIEDEIKNGWFNVVSAAVVGQVVGQDGTTPSAVPTDASFVNNVREQPVNITQPQVSLKNLPASWLLAGSSILTFLVTLLIVFLIQSIVSPANANDTKTKATPPAATSSFSDVETVSTDSSLGLPGVNGEALVAAQQQTVTDILKDMGIDATHNQQDLSCLVQ